MGDRVPGDVGTFHRGFHLWLLHGMLGEALRGAELVPWAWDEWAAPRGRAALGLAPLSVGDPWWAGGMAPHRKAKLLHPHSSRDWESQLLAVGDEEDAA